MSRGPRVLAQCTAVNIKLSQHFKDDDVNYLWCQLLHCPAKEVYVLV